MTLSAKDFSNDQHGWAEFLPERIPNPSCKGELRSSWTIVGAGLTGLACARRLAELHPDDEIILLDARAVAQAASGRNSGYVVVNSQFGGPFDSKQVENYSRINRLNRAGLNLLSEQVRKHNINCEWHEQGFYHAVADNASLREVGYFSDYLENMEIPHSLMDQSALAEKLGTEWYQSGVHVHEGALVQPAALVYGLADSLPENVTLYENSAVLNTLAGNNSIRSATTLQTTDAIIVTDNVIVTANFESAKIGLNKSHILGSTLSGSFTRKLTQEELDSLGSLKQWGALSLHAAGATVRLTQDGRLCVRNTAEYLAGRLMTDQMLAQRSQIHRQAFENRFPQLRNVPFETSWSGVEGISRNMTNFFQNPEKGLYLAGGFNGSGVSRGTAFGTAMAEYASGGQSTLINDCLASPKAQWMPPRPILDVAAWFSVRQVFKGVGRDG
ncbi:MAG: FAD-dependent oxidoreductase [Cocleimonas sp.]